MKKPNKKLKADPTPNAPAGSGTEPAPSVATEKPDIFRYHFYIDYLKDWIEFKRLTQKGFSLRRLALECGFATGYLPMVLAGKRPLSVEGLRKLMPAVGLSPSEKHFLESMHALGTTSSQAERVESIKHMKSYQRFRESNPDESEVYEYLSNWHYFTIRELAADPEFQMDATWVQSRLRNHVPLKDVQAALDFLVQHEYIEVGEDGKVTPPQKRVYCAGGIYRIALGQYHKQLFKLAERAIENADSTERNILGHTFAIPPSKYQEVKELIDQTIERVQAIAQGGSPEPREAVYHLEVALFPLTKIKSGSEK